MAKAQITCSVDDCNLKVRSKGLCGKHYDRMRAHGTTVFRTERTLSVRPVQIVGDVAYVTLTRGYHAIIDASDAQAIGTHNWSALSMRQEPQNWKTVHSAGQYFCIAKY